MPRPVRYSPSRGARACRTPGRLHPSVPPHPPWSPSGGTRPRPNNCNGRHGAAGPWCWPRPCGGCSRRRSRASRKNDRCRRAAHAGAQQPALGHGARGRGRGALGGARDRLCHQQEGQEVERSVGTGVVIVDRGIIDESACGARRRSHRRDLPTAPGLKNASIIGAQPENDLAVLGRTSCPTTTGRAAAPPRTTCARGRGRGGMGFPFGISTPRPTPATPAGRWSRWTARWWASSPPSSTPTPAHLHRHRLCRADRNAAGPPAWAPF